MRPDIVALLYGLAGLVFIAIGISLAEERVPPNHWHGFRTAKTFSNQTIWYAANRVAAEAVPCRVDGSLAGFSHEVFQLGEDLLSPPKDQSGSDRANSPGGRCAWLRGASGVSYRIAFVTSQVVERGDVAWAATSGRDIARIRRGTARC